MPQPFHRYKNEEVTLSPGILISRPALALGIALIASHWNKLEHTFSLMHTYLLAGKKPDTFEQYHALIAMRKRKEAFVSAAKHKIPGNLLEEARNLYDNACRLGKNRSDVVHGTWAITPSRPESLLLCDAKDLNLQVNKVFHGLESMIKNPGRQHSFSVDLSRVKYMEYKQSDFQFIIDRIIALDEKTMKLANEVLSHSLNRLAAKP